MVRNMRVESFEVTSIEAKRFSGTKEKLKNLRVDQNSTVTQIDRVSDETASIEFRFLVNYSNKGFIKIEGGLKIMGELDELMDKWSSEGNMTNEVANIVHNVVVSNCLPTALLVSRDVKLPPPIPLPKINLKKKGEKPPTDSVEVA